MKTQKEKYKENPEYREHKKLLARTYHTDHKEEIKIKRKAYFADYRLKHKDEINSKSHHYNTTDGRKARRNKFYVNNKELDKHRTRRAYLKRMFNITLEQYEDMVKSQGDCCAICGKHRTKNGKRLAVDHCHFTGNIRGLLCGPCNQALGIFKDDVNLLHKAIQHLQKESPLIKASNLEYFI